MSVLSVICDINVLYLSKESPRSILNCEGNGELIATLPFLVSAKALTVTIS